MHDEKPEKEDEYFIKKRELGEPNNTDTHSKS